MAAAPVEEDRNPAADSVLAQAHRVALVRHADDDETDARPGVEPLVDEVQFTRTVAHEHRGERGAEAAAAGVSHAARQRGRVASLSGHVLMVCAFRNVIPGAD
jgi:hypothetical protein